MSKQPVGWGSLTRQGRIANRKWYRFWRDKRGSRFMARQLVEAQIWGATFGPDDGWVKSVEVHYGS